MKDAVAETILILVGLLAGISILMFVAMLSSKSHQMEYGVIDREAKNYSLNKVAEAQSFVDINRAITGDDMIEFITDNGARYKYMIKTYKREGADNRLNFSEVKGRYYIEAGSKEYTEAKNKVKSAISATMPEGEAELYANTALWSQTYLTKLLGDRLPSKFKPVIYVNRSGIERVLDSSDIKYDVTRADSRWTNIKETSIVDGKTVPIPYTFIDVVDSEEEYVIVYEEVE